MQFKFGTGLQIEAWQWQVRQWQVKVGLTDNKLYAEMGSHHSPNTLSVLQMSVLEKMRVAQYIMDAGWIKVKIKDMLLGSAMVPHARHGFHPTSLNFSPDCRRISWMSHARDDTDMLRWSYFSAQRHGQSGLYAMTTMMMMITTTMTTNEATFTDLSYWSNKQEALRHEAINYWEFFFWQWGIKHGCFVWSFTSSHALSTSSSFEEQ